MLYYQRKSHRACHGEKYGGRSSHLGWTRSQAAIRPLEFIGRDEAGYTGLSPKADVDSTRTYSHQSYQTSTRCNLGYHIMLTPFENESLYSLILRGLIINGQRKFNSTIGLNGQWLKTPFIHSNIQYLFHGIDDAKFLEISIASGVINNDVGIFENPALVIHSLRQIYGVTEANTHPIKGTKEIRFCTLCIRESIRLNGCGYFKADWLFSENCSIHEHSLQMLSFHSGCNVSHEILQILSGRHENKNLISTNTKQAKKSIVFSLARPKNGIDYNGNKLYIMPCLKKNIHRWLAKNVDILYESNVSMRYSLSRDAYYASTAKYKFMNDGKLHMYIKNLLKHKDQYFMEYFEKSFQPSLHYFGMRRPDSFCETLYKSTDSNCSRCQMLASDGEPCPLNLNISRFRLNELVQWPSRALAWCD